MPAAPLLSRYSYTCCSVAFPLIIHLAKLSSLEMKFRPFAQNFHYFFDIFHQKNSFF